MTVHASSALFTSRQYAPAREGEPSVLPAWLLAIVLMTFFALVTLGSIEPFHYDGVGRHLAVAALFVAYVLVWKEIFRRYVVPPQDTQGS